MRDRLISLFQKTLGFERYLFLISLFVYYKFRWDKNEKDFLSIFDVIHDDGIVLDIGANIGVMTAQFSKRLPNSIVYSFEPVPYNLRTLKRVISYFKLKNVTVYDFALGDSNGQTKIVVPISGAAKKQGLSHIIDVNENAKGEEFEIEIKRLDDLPEFKNSTKKITAIKIDVEGYEYFVLNGGKELIKKNRPVIYCELWTGPERERTFELMKSLQYNIKVAQNNKLVDFKNQFKYNFYFIPG
jgi:FkbM family methyltransferase